MREGRHDPRRPTRPSKHREGTDHENPRIPGEADSPRSGRGRAPRMRRRHAASRRRRLREPGRARRPCVKAQIHAGGRGKGTIADIPASAASSWSAAARRRKRSPATCWATGWSPSRPGRRARPSIACWSKRAVRSPANSISARSSIGRPERPGAHRLVGRRHGDRARGRRDARADLHRAVRPRRRTAAAPDPQARLAAGPAATPHAAAAEQFMQALVPRVPRSAIAASWKSTRWC